jgi:16S rRNA (cytosine1402-N4)-methyltransferase
VPAPSTPAHNPAHTPVLLTHCITVLAPGSQPNETYLDCTAGLGGHAAAIAARTQPGSTIILNDADAANLALAQAHVAQAAPQTTVRTHHGNFAAVSHALEAWRTPADMLLADLGFASNHVDEASRGFSFKRDGPLDMRMNVHEGPTAAQLLASLSEAELTRILLEYGEERAARIIARKLVETRKRSPILTTGQLADLVRSVVPVNPAKGGIDPATRTFQALRIAVNDELGSLEALLMAIADGIKQVSLGKVSWLRPGARIAIISFHSLEDRAVKQAFARFTNAGCTDLTKGCLTADEAEAAANPRARSAKLRALALPAPQIS